MWGCGWRPHPHMIFLPILEGLYRALDEAKFRLEVERPAGDRTPRGVAYRAGKYIASISPSR